VYPATVKLAAGGCTRFSSHRPSPRRVPARRLTAILPQMTLAEATETNLTRSVAGHTGDRTTSVIACPCRLYIHASGYGADWRGAGAAALDPSAPNFRRATQRLFY
jgi:hypothetical protein